MSLYYEAASFLTSQPFVSLTSRLFKPEKPTKADPKQIYALVTETASWSPVLAEVVDRAQILHHEAKLSPALALLLVHDLLIVKRGVAAPAAHPLRKAVERHKARLAAELGRVRVRRKCVSIDQLKEQLCIEAQAALGEWPRPRWIRVNTIKTTLAEQLETTLATYDRASELQDVLRGGSRHILFIDRHVPDLVAVPRSIPVTKWPAYLDGRLILQDKASCLPAVLLCGDGHVRGSCIDACAAPGNKTTHLAALTGDKVHALERDRLRAKSLIQMVNKTGAQNVVKVHEGQDFLLLPPNTAPWNDVCALLLDPSCSGSGILGRDEVLRVMLPNPLRKQKDAQPELIADTNSMDRLEALSAFQLKLILHAFSFPNARRISYSTCSLHAIENEGVVVQALASEEAKQHGWRLMSRAEQPRALQEWQPRGDASFEKEIVDACIRCEMGTAAGTQGFFLAGFVRNTNDSAFEEWHGFD